MSTPNDGKSRDGSNSSQFANRKLQSGRAGRRTCDVSVSAPQQTRPVVSRGGTVPIDLPVQIIHQFAELTLDLCPSAWLGVHRNTKAC